MKDDPITLLFSVAGLFLFGMCVMCLYRFIKLSTGGQPGAQRALTGALSWLAASGICFALALPAVSTAREALKRSQCINNIKQIMLAMHNYHDTNRGFPPAYTVDKNGRPLHSWRVLILPFVEQNVIFAQVYLNEPYDSPRNLAAFNNPVSEGVKVAHSPDFFFCPSDAMNRTETNYAMVLGSRTISDGPNSVRLREITDGASNTIAVVETRGTGIRWYEPRDLRVGNMSFTINDPKQAGIASRHPGGANVGLVDGNVRLLGGDTSPKTVEAMTTINGGEKQTPF